MAYKVIQNADLTTLAVGTKFYVHNGAWNGEIVEIDGVKQVLVEETQRIHSIEKQKDHGLDISIK